MTVGPLCTTLISAWLHHAGSEYRQMVPFNFGTIVKLLHYSVVSSTPRGMIICCSCQCSNCFLNGSFNAYASCLGCARYVFVSSLIVTKICLLKNPMPEKTLLYVSSDPFYYSWCLQPCQIYFSSPAIMFYIFWLFSIK